MSILGTWNFEDCLQLCSCFATFRKQPVNCRKLPILLNVHYFWRKLLDFTLSSLHCQPSVQKLQLVAISPLAFPVKRSIFTPWTNNHFCFVSGFLLRFLLPLPLSSLLSRFNRLRLADAEGEGDEESGRRCGERSEGRWGRERVFSQERRSIAGPQWGGKKRRQKIAPLQRGRTTVSSPSRKPQRKIFSGTSLVLGSLLFLSLSLFFSLSSLCPSFLGFSLQRFQRNPLLCGLLDSWARSNGNGSRKHTGLCQGRAFIENVGAIFRGSLNFILPYHHICFGRECFYHMMVHRKISGGSRSCWTRRDWVFHVRASSSLAGNPCSLLSFLHCSRCARAHRGEREGLFEPDKGLLFPSTRWPRFL